MTKKGYLVGSKDAQAATFYKNRFAVILIAAILIAATFLTVTQAVVAGAVMLAAAEIAYRRSFLKKLEPVEDVDFERRVTALQYIVNEKSKGQTLSLAVLYLLAAVLVVLNALDQKYGTGLLVLSGSHRADRPLFQRASFHRAGEDQPEGKRKREKMNILRGRPSPFTRMKSLPGAGPAGIK